MARLLEDRFDLLATAENGRELLERVAWHKPDLVVLDVTMPEMNGLEAARNIHKCYPQIKIVFLSMHTERAYVTDAFRAGGLAYVSKRAAASELVTAISEALAGRAYVSQGIEPVEILSEPGPRDRALTPRQVEVLRLVARGMSAKEIGSALHVSPKTVEFHKARIMEKVDLRTTAELTRYALGIGIVEN